MKQYILYAWDGPDELAHDRRWAARPAHFDCARKLKSTGNFIQGGAILDQEGNMIGSMMLLQFEQESELQAWLSEEPYIRGNVWKKWELHPFRLAEI